MQLSIRYFLSIFLGIIIGGILIGLSERIGFSHINLLPFGGPSWALWFYLIAPSLGVLVASFIFKVPHKALFCISFFLIILIMIYLIADVPSDFFMNPMPFGKGL